jgi:hypothetical protein
LLLQRHEKAEWLHEKGQITRKKGKEAQAKKGAWSVEAEDKTTMRQPIIQTKGMRRALEAALSKKRNLLILALSDELASAAPHLPTTLIESNWREHVRI